MSWSTLPGWRADDALAAWPALIASCTAIHARPEWQQFCADVAAASPMDSEFVRGFLEQRLQPYRVWRAAGRERASKGMITGYYEPLLHGSRERSEQFATPLYSRPDDLLIVDLASLYPELKGKRVRGRLEGNKVVPYYSRAASRDAPALAGHEIVWIDDALDAFMLEIQGSGRVQLTTGETIRLQYEDQNGHPYRSIGRYLADQGVMTIDQVSTPAIPRGSRPIRSACTRCSTAIRAWCSSARRRSTIPDRAEGRAGRAADRGPFHRHRPEIPAPRGAHVSVHYRADHRRAVAATRRRPGHGRRDQRPRARGSVLRLRRGSRRAGRRDEVRRRDVAVMAKRGATAR